MPVEQGTMAAGDRPGGMAQKECLFQRRQCNREAVSRLLYSYQGSHTLGADSMVECVEGRLHLGNGSRQRRNEDATPSAERWAGIPIRSLLTSSRPWSHARCRYREIVLHLHGLTALLISARAIMAVTSRLTSLPLRLSQASANRSHSFFPTCRPSHAARQSVNGRQHSAISSVVEMAKISREDDGAKPNPSGCC